MVSPGPERDVFMNNGPVYFRSSAHPALANRNVPLVASVSFPEWLGTDLARRSAWLRVRSEAIRELPEIVELTFTCQ